MTGNRSGRLPWYKGPWLQVRKFVLERDGHICQIRGKRCTTKATEVDHIVPAGEGGAWFDPANLRAACRPCNRDRVHPVEGWRKARTHITLVWGPPCGGKTTYVREHAGPTDLVVDYDLLAQAMGSTVSHGHANHDAVTTARNALLAKLRNGATSAPRAWIVSANAKAPSLFPHHDDVLRDPGRDEALRRAGESGRPALWVELIEKWYATASVATEAPSRQW